MDLEVLRAFFLWCIIINIIILIGIVVAMVKAGDWAFLYHNKWFKIPREVFNTTIYAYAALLELLMIFFNLVPFIALSIIG